MSTFKADRITLQASVRGAAPEAGRQESQSVEETLEELDERLRSILAILHDLDEGLIELTLSALPFGQRAALEAYDIIAPATGDDADSTMLLTPFGRQVLAACALEQASPDVRDAIAELDEARAHRQATARTERVRVHSNRKS